MFIQINLPKNYNDGAPIPDGLTTKIIDSIVAVTGGVTVLFGKGIWRGGDKTFDEPMLLVQATHNCDHPFNKADIIGRIKHIAKVAAGVLDQKAIYVQFDNRHELVGKDDKVRGDVRRVMNG